MKKIIISGGGTGGHIYPAVSIANALKKAYSAIEILFVGAEGKMEMEKIPTVGYPIIGLPVAGLQRRFTLKNLAVPFKLMKSLRKASKIIKDFKPDAVVGVGGYASGPVLKRAAKKGIPTVLQEQNSYAGLTNKLLAKKARLICVAYDGMERFFPKEKIMLTGNPIRQDLFDLKTIRAEALEFFQLDLNRKTLLILGGSLGARTINESVIAALELLQSSNIQVILQTGKFYIDQVRQAWDKYKPCHVKVHDFIYRMDYAYAAADVIISRAGAGTISELCMVGKPCILVPSPNVAEDHQTKNAMSLVNKQAALLVTDKDARKQLVEDALKLSENIELMANLSSNIKKLALPDAADRIAAEIIKLANGQTV
ncbi:MAG: undecaprenyldiphospho-muramoylpentapeptide beta-N-acetylglucosaminyltransferase [Prevotellaceae bacterium]|nr:undecaprenyldiphospho-muramoylpentapeptide beta-N-acetylglucosaminyltransferase [Prevotellaceae bacterium]